MPDLVSVNLSLPREVTYRGRTVLTGIFKEPAEGPVMLRSSGLDGDGQADRSAHGGRDMAALAYPVEHYDYWREELPEANLGFGMFGENFTTMGLLEDDIRIGDRFRIGGAEVVVSQPRTPCVKLGIRFGRDDMMERFMASSRCGFYLRVCKEGEVRTGEAVDLIRRSEEGITVAEILHLRLHDVEDRERLGRAVALEALSEKWRKHFQGRLERSPG